MLNKEEARQAWTAAGLSKNDPFMIALRDPKLWLSAIGTLGAAYLVLFIIRAVVCCGA